MLYITLRQYEYVVAIADAGSLTEAANRLNVAQPSLSVAITRIEDRLGASLFSRRKGAAIETTPFGHRFIQNARELLEKATDLERGENTSLPFVLGCFEDIAPWYLAPALDKLRSQLPETDIQGKEGRFSNLSAEIAEGRVDIAITYDIGFEGRFERRTIEKVSPVAFVAADHPLAKKPSVELSDLPSYPLLFFSEPLSGKFMQNLFNRMRLAPEIRHRATSLELMRSLAANGAGVGISYSHPPSEISYDGKPVVTIPIVTPEAVAEIKLLWSSLREPNEQFEKILNALTC